MVAFSEHSVDCFFSFPYDFNEGLAVTLGDLVNPTNNEIDGSHWIPVSLHECIQLDYGHKKIFEEKTSSLSPDLYWPVQDLLAGRKPDRCKVYGLSKDAANLFRVKEKCFLKRLDGAEKTPFSLVMRTQTKSVLKRVNEITDIHDDFFVNDSLNDRKVFVYPINLSDIIVYSFSTQNIVVKVRLNLRLSGQVEIDSDLLTEFVSEAGRLGSLSWVAGLPNISPTEREKLTNLQDQVLQTEISEPLEQVVYSLITGKRRKCKTTKRSYTYCYARVADNQADIPQKEMMKFATLTSRQFTSDYEINHQLDAEANVSYFTNLVHFLKREGGVTAVNPHTNGKAVEFLATFSSGPLEKSYLPLVVLNIHQLACSLDLLEKANKEVCEIIRGEDQTEFKSLIDAYAKIKDELTLLKGLFRFKQVSQISMHNDFNLAIRDSFKLDDIENQLDEMLDDVTSRSERALNNHELAQQRLFSQKYNWISILATAAIAGVLFMEYVNTGVNLLSDGASLTDGIIIIICVVVVLCGYLWGSRKLKAGSE
ncbi:hypothetical protein [Terasakiella pusilla]|uniref:hypothetical protein n=1 Tax=Terasakiella pusilla TaxID=64973 RepID=UPI003AA7B16A